MKLKDFEKEFTERHIPSGWNVYEWIRNNKETAIAQAFFRTRRIMNRADFIQTNISGGKDSALAFHIANLELKYRKDLQKIIRDKNLEDLYEYKDIRYLPNQGINDFDNFENTEESYNSLENINLNIPMLYLSTQDPELIFSDAIRHIQLDVNLSTGYGIYIFNDKIVCGYDIAPKYLRDKYNIEIYADLWLAIEGENYILDAERPILERYNVDKVILDAIDRNHFPYAGKRTRVEGGKEFFCIVKGDQTGHMFYKCLSISYQDGSSYSSGRFVAWDKTKEDIWCREMPIREDHGLDPWTNYNMMTANMLPISKVKPELVDLHKDRIVDVDGVKCLPNWGFGSRSLCETDKAYERMFGSLMRNDENGNYLETHTYISQSDEDSGGSEVDTFGRWLMDNTPPVIAVNYTGKEEVTHPTQIYNLVSIRAAESFDRFTILKQSDYFTGQYGRSFQKEK